MKRLLIVGTILVPAFAFAQGTQAPPYTPGSTTNTCPSGGPNPCFIRSFASTPVPGAQMGLGITSATALTVPTGAVVAQITVEGQSVRCRDDNVAPTASVGVLYPVATVIVVWQPALSQIQCIQTTATATLDVAYYK